MNIDELREKLDKYIDVSSLSDYQVLKIYEEEQGNKNSYLKEVLNSC